MNDENFYLIVVWYVKIKMIIKDTREKLTKNKVFKKHYTVKHSFIALHINLIFSLKKVKNYPFFFENASNLTHEFFYDNFSKKI